MKFTQNQCDELGAINFVEKLCAEMARAIPAFHRMVPAAQREFVVQNMREAGRMGMVTEQGVAAYVLAVWWLGAGFTAMSSNLGRLLESSYPEVRKVYAMNEWVHASLARPDDFALADERLKSAFYETKAWGTDSGSAAGGAP